jgi:shikimate 5-dehydrogenase
MRYVTPSLIIGSGGVSPTAALVMIRHGLEATVSSETDARAVLAELGLSEEEINFRFASA